MTRSISVATLREHEACDLDLRIADLARHMGREVPDETATQIADLNELLGL